MHALGEISAMGKDPVESISPHISVLSPSQINEIHSASLEILGRTGVKVCAEEVVELLRAAGAYVSDGRLVKIPTSLVEKALDSAPQRVVLYSRDGEQSVLLGDRQTHFGIMADCPETIDPYTRERRAFVADDVRRSAIVGDYLPNIHFIATAGWSTDYPAAVADRVAFRQMLLYTSKPIGFCCFDTRGLADILEMASIVAGSREALRQKPFIFHYSEPISPLTHSQEALWKVLLCAEEGIPLVYTPMPIAGATAPATFAGTLALNIAETLSGLVIAQLKRAGSPFIFGGIPAPLDMRTTIFPYGAPELYLMCAALADMAHYYKLPMFGTAGCSDAKMLDQQAALECALSCLMAALSGANLIHDVGVLDHCTIISLEIMVLTNEIIGMIDQIMKGIEVSQETLALDLIDRIGPGGNYLAEEHTVRHFRKW